MPIRARASRSGPSRVERRLDPRRRSLRSALRETQQGKARLGVPTELARSDVGRLGTLDVAPQSAHLTDPVVDFGDAGHVQVRKVPQDAGRLLLGPPPTPP